MRIRPILLGLLGATACTVCKGNEPEPFSVDTTLDATDLADFEAWLAGDSGASGTASAADASCNELCTWAAQREGHYGDEVHIDDCAHTVDTDTAHVTCSGSTTYYCEGRRPRGHQDRPTHLRPDLGATLAHFAELEAASVPAFDELAAHLEAHSAPAELVARCRTAAEDERRHLVSMGRAARFFGGQPVVPERAAPPTPSLLELALDNAVEGCVAETFAAMLAHHHAEVAPDPRLRALFFPIAEDETEHAQLAHDLHAWFLSQLSEAEAERVRAARRTALAELPVRAAVLGAMLPPELGTSVGDARALAEGLAERLAA